MGNIVLNSERFGSSVVFIEECESTNDLALQYSRKVKAKQPMVFVANYQTNGRGQRGNTWVSSKGANLTFSMLWFPDQLQIKDQFFLNKVSSLAVAKLLVDLGVSLVKVKWPNDVYVSEKKIAGILIENMATGKFITSSVIGIGLNLNQSQVQGVNMVSLAELVKLKLSKSELCKKIIHNMDYFLDAVKRNDFNIDDFYLSNLYALNSRCMFKNLKDNHFVGSISGITSDGSLKIDTSDGVKSFAFKEVSLVSILE